MVEPGAIMPASGRPAFRRFGHAIASAIEEQGAATQEIARNVSQAAKGTAEVAGNIGEVSHGAAETGTASSQVLSSARQLSGDSNRLRSEVEDDKRSRLQDSLGRERRCLESARREIRAFRPTVPNSVVARILGVPKGTVDSGLYYLKRREPIRK